VHAILNAHWIKDKVCEYLAERRGQEVANHIIKILVSGSIMESAVQDSGT
jgi:hypothetical protein